MEDNGPDKDPKSLSAMQEVHKSIFENIKFIDQKALVFVTLTCALMGIDFSVLKDFKPVPMCLGMGICVILAIGILGGVIVVYPRGP